MDNEDNVLLVVNGIMRSGTIWLTRLLADSLGVPSRTRYNDPPFGEDAGDSAVWHLERPGKFIRRLHHFASEYTYSDVVPLVIIIRDPRDVLVSQMSFYEWPLDEIVQRGLMPWLNFYGGWRKDPRPCLWVKYEDLLLDTTNIIKRIILKSRLLADHISIEEAIAAHTFSGENTQLHNRQKGLYGRAGAWRNVMPSWMADGLWRDYGAEIASFGFEEH